MDEVHGVKSIYFELKHVPKKAKAFVAWADLMGVQSLLRRSLPTSANAIFKFHAAALEERPAGVKLYPMMDGLYAVSPDATDLQLFLRGLFSRCAAHFICKPDNQHRFIPKAAVAYGDVVHGDQVGVGAAAVFKTNAHHKDALLVGEPMVRAYLHDKYAPPFGIAIDVTASAFLTDQQKKNSHVWWPWYDEKLQPLAVDLREQMLAYYAWCAERSGLIDYDSSRIKVHQEQSVQYLTHGNGA